MDAEANIDVNNCVRNIHDLRLRTTFISLFLHGLRTLVIPIIIQVERMSPKWSGNYVVTCSLIVWESK